MQENTRKAKILVNEEWTDINPLEIKMGMGFKLFEEDGTPVIHNDITIFIASGDAYINKDGIITVNTYSM